MSRLGRGFPNNALMRPPPLVVVPAVYDATGAGQATHSSSLSWSHTISGNAVLMWITTIINTSTPTLTAKVGSAPMTQVAALANYVNWSAGYPMNLFVYGLLKPPTGAQTVTLTVSGASDAYIGANSVSYQNVTGFGVPVTNTGTGTTASVSASSPGQMVAEGFGNNDQTSGGGFTSYSKTSRYSLTHTGNSAALLIGDASGSGVQNFSATQNSSTFAAIAVPLI